MLAAVLIIIVMAGILTALAAITISSINKSSESRDYTFFLQAADTAVNDAVLRANSYEAGFLDTKIGKANAIKGALPEDAAAGIKWQWYAEDASGTVKYSKYNIYATGYRTSPTEKGAVTVKATVHSLPVEQASHREGDVMYYTMSPSALMAEGFVGLNGVFVGNEAVRVSSYDSAKGLTPGGNLGGGNLVTNENIVFGYSSTNITTPAADFGTLYSTSSEKPIEGRCYGVSGSPCPITIISSNFGIAGDDPASRMAEVCGTAAQPNWVASEHMGANGVAALEGNTGAMGESLCANNVVFDVDTQTLTKYTTGRPLTIYASGDVTIEDGIEVSGAQNQFSFGPLSLRLISAGSNLKMNSQDGQSTFAGVVVAPRATCSIGDPGSTNAAMFKGSLACNSLRIDGKTALWHDYQTVQALTNNAANQKRIWNIARYENLTVVPKD